MSEINLDNLQEYDETYVAPLQDDVDDMLGRELSTRTYSEVDSNKLITLANLIEYDSIFVKPLEKDVIDLKEALFGYVLDTTNVSITDTIPTTTTIGTTTYNLCDNVRGLVKSVSGNTSKSENLLVIADKESTTINGITYSITNGVVKFNGTATANTNISIINPTLNNGTYTLANLGDTTSTLRLYKPSGNENYTSGSFTIDGTETEIVLLRYIPSGTTFTNATIKPMLVSGTTAPSTFKRGYNGLKSVEYNGLEIKDTNGTTTATILQYPTTLNGVGTAKDTLELLEQDNGLYTLKKTTRIETLVLNGSNTNWANAGDIELTDGTTTHSFYSNNYFTRSSVADLGVGNSSAIVLPHKYDYNNLITSSNKTTKYGLRLVSNSNGLRIFIRTLGETTSNEVNTYLSSNPLTIIYPLATPTEATLATDLTKEQVMAILQLNGSVDIINSNSEFVGGSSSWEMVYKLIDTENEINEYVERLFNNALEGEY